MIFTTMFIYKTFSSNERKALFNRWDRGHTCWREYFKQTIFLTPRAQRLDFSRQSYSGRTVAKEILGNRDFVPEVTSVQKLWLGWPSMRIKNLCRPTKLVHLIARMFFSKCLKIVSALMRIKRPHSYNFCSEVTSEIKFRFPSINTLVIAAL